MSKGCSTCFLPFLCLFKKDHFLLLIITPVTFLMQGPVWSFWCRSSSLEPRCPAGRELRQLPPLGTNQESLFHTTLLFTTISQMVSRVIFWITTEMLKKTKSEDESRDGHVFCYAIGDMPVNWVAAFSVPVESSGGNRRVKAINNQ